jgi:competence transcription factor ComK
MYVPLFSVDHLHHWCLLNGKSLAGCITSARYFLGNIKKATIYINNEACFFSIKDNDEGCLFWINANMVLKVSKVSSFLSRLSFVNKEDMIICVNVRALLKQVERCRFLSKVLDHQEID